jgi:hypothetical protein
MRFAAVALLGALLASATPAVAQPSVPLPAPDFLFGKPKGSIGVRGGWTFARAGSDWYDFVTSNLTLENKDFNRPAVGFDVGVALSRRIDVVINLDYSKAKSLSEYRDFVDNRRLPIEQTTELQQVNFGGSVKVYLLERGREVSRLAWVPRVFVPYVGGGAGVLWYQMNQYGDFVDFVDFSVFGEAFESRALAPAGQIFGGVDVKVWKRLYVGVDVRHLWAAADLGRDWIDFDPIDLTGTRVAAGINIVF